jgi:hypothetical protein
MERFLSTMILRTHGRPVLQFNRVDFRLPWIRRRLPGASVVHIHRNPRDQWCSTLLDVTRFPRDASLRDFAPHDGFYLLNWARDLAFAFPFLEPDTYDHPYELFWVIWRMSLLFGRRYSDISLAFEELVTQPRAVLAPLLARLDLPHADLDVLAALVDPPPLGRWTRYADEVWFAEQEARGEARILAALR